MEQFRRRKLGLLDPASRVAIAVGYHSVHMPKGSTQRAMEWEGGGDRQVLR